MVLLDRQVCLDQAQTYAGEAVGTVLAFKEASELPQEPVAAVWTLLRPWWYLKGVEIRSGEIFGAGSGLR